MSESEPIDFETHTKQLAAISVASLHNTEDSRKDRLPKTSDYWTCAYEDVCKAVDREIMWRNACEQARAKLDEFIQSFTDRNDVPEMILETRSLLADWRFV